MTARSARVLAALFLGAMPVGLDAQTPDQFALAIARADVNGTTPLASPESQVHLEAREKGGVLSALFGVSFGPDDRASLALQLSGELDKGAEEVELANRHNLPGGITASLKFSYGSSADKWIAHEPLEAVCKAVNDELVARLPAYEPGVLERLDGAEDKEGEERYAAYRDFIVAFEAARLDRGAALDRRKAELAKAKSALSPAEERERVALALPLPEISELEARAVTSLCASWNKSRMDGLLLERPVGSEGEVRPKQVVGHARWRTCSTLMRWRGPARPVAMSRAP